MNEPAQEIRVRVFVRHKATCDYSGEEGYARCRCAKWLRYSRHGKQFRQPANTRSFGTAEEKAREQYRILAPGVGRVTANQSESVAFLRPAAIQCAGRGPDVDWHPVPKSPFPRILMGTRNILLHTTQNCRQALYRNLQFQVHSVGGLGDAKCDRVYCATTLLDILEELARLKPAANK